MKYFILSFIFTLALSTISLSAFAQQQINYNGASGGDLQQQNNGNSLQDAPTYQQTAPVTQNAGSEILQNAPNKPLTVVGAESNQNSPKNDTSIIGWVTLSAIFLLILMSPALMYARHLNNNEQLTKNSPEPSAKTKTQNTNISDNTKITPKNVATSPEAKNLEKTKPVKKKPKKASNNKVKRKKKKK